jgi:hypothetical protein
MRTTLFSSVIGDVPANLAFTNNYAATTNPAVGNDSTQGYSPGSVWINATTDQAFLCTDSTAGAAVWASTTDGGAQGQTIAPAATTPTGTGGTALLRGGAGGTTSGAGGPAQLTGGAATAGNSNGGSAVIQGGAANGSGVAGSVRELGLVMRSQGAEATLNATGTLTAAQVINGIITSSTAAAVVATLPLATAMDTAIPDAVAGDSFDFSVINTGVANTFTVATAAGWTIVGNLVVPFAAANVQSSGRFRARKTGAGAWTLYRIA